MRDTNDPSVVGSGSQSSVRETLEGFWRKPLSARQLTLAQVLSFSFIVALVSSLGQTFFISLFVPQVQADLSLDPASVGTIYGSATLVGALVLPSFGAWFDRADLLRFTVAATLILLVGCLAFASARGITQLFIAFALLRLAGPGLYSHIASAGPARYFTRGRGTVLSFAALGFTAGEGFLPSAAVHAVALFGWRFAFLAAGASACLLILPAASRLVSRRKRFRGARRTAERQPADHQALLAFGRSLWALLPILLLPAGLETGLIFHQGKLAAAKGLGLSVFATAFVVYAFAQVAGSLAVGRLIDRLGSFLILLLHALPMAAGCLVLAASDNRLAVWLFMAGTALTATANNLLRTTLIIELFGSTHLGASRSRLSVLFTIVNAASPIIVGIAISAGAGAAMMLSAASLLLFLAPMLALLKRRSSEPLVRTR